MSQYFSFDQIFHSSTLQSIEQLTDALQAAAKAANKGARSRKVWALDLPDFAARTQGISYRTGGGVCNSYGYRATSSVVGMAWYTDDSGLHIRIVGGRVGVHSSRYGRTSGFGQD